MSSFHKKFFIFRGIGNIINKNYEKRKKGLRRTAENLEHLAL